ncbi:MAG: hypothetical protein GKR87_03130 [Kiritimatiellae bacterium]|nr:hypothetical protein [Kiritimatiellia bacterium]
MEYTEEHYQRLLGLKDSWAVQSVNLSVENRKVSIEVQYESVEASCSKYAKIYKIYDHQEKRSWRHLDPLQFVTELHSTTPRINCTQHGILNIKVLWAEKHSPLTRMALT